MPRTPDAFHTSSCTKLSLSAAFSTQFNRRGLEANYTPAWISTLNGACSFSNRLSTAGESYLSVPGDVIRRFQLEATEKKLQQAQRDLMAAAPQNQPALNQRSSVRIRHAQQKRHEDAVTEIEEQLESVKENKTEYPLQIQSLELEDGYDPDMSLEITSISDRRAQDNRADISVAHVVGGYLPTLGRDASASIKAKYAARAGIKVVHRCLVLIGELKSAPSRRRTSPFKPESTSGVKPNQTGDEDEDEDDDGSKNEEGNKNEEESERQSMWYKDLQSKLQEAKVDLIYYCAVHFLLHPDNDQVIGLISAGPFWVWAVVDRDTLPDYDWSSRTVYDNEENEVKTQAFEALFEEDKMCILGTPESDSEIDKVVEVIRKIVEQCGKQKYPTPAGYREVPDIGDEGEEL